MIFIREALERDIDGIVKCAEHFFKYASYADLGLYLDNKSFAETVIWQINDKHSVVLLLMDDLYVAGGISGSFPPWHFNKHTRVCLEFFYWVEPKYRGRNSYKLITEFEQYCEVRGADHIIMLSVPTELAAGVERLYERRGYKPLEKLFIKEVGK